MCRAINNSKETTSSFTGAIPLANLPALGVVEVILAPCVCGNTVWGRMKDGGGIWAEIQEVES